MSSDMSRVDLIRSNKKIKSLIKAGIEKNGDTYGRIVDDAKAAGIQGLTGAHLSRYLNANDTDDRISLGIITQRHIIWLCKRYSIKIKVDAKKI